MSTEAQRKKWRAYARDYYLANAEICRERRRAWNARNKDYLRESYRAWRAKHPNYPLIRKLRRAGIITNKEQSHA